MPLPTASRPAPHPAAIIFDLDGTLIDSVADMTVALNRLLAECGARRLAEPEVRDMVGDGATELVRRACTTAGYALAAEQVAPTVARYLDLYAGLPVSPDCLYPGVVETLETLAAAGIRLGLCTNKAERVMRPVLAGIGLTRFFGEAAFGADMLPVRKPDPAPLLWVLERLGNTPPQHAVMVGDGLNDVLSGRAAGMPVVAVSYGYARGPVAGLGADVVIDRFADLPAALTGLPSATRALPWTHQRPTAFGNR